MESAENWDKIHVDHRNSPASLFPVSTPPASSFSPHSFYKAFMSSPPIRQEEQEKEMIKAERCSQVKFCPNDAAAAELYIPLPLSTMRLTGKPCG